MSDNLRSDVLQLQVSHVVSGTTDPSAVGLAAPEGSTYLQFVSGAGALWVKTTAPDTGWQLVAVGVVSGNTLTGAYNEGGPAAGADVAATDGPMTITLTNVSLAEGAFTVSEDNLARTAPQAELLREVLATGAVLEIRHNSVQGTINSDQVGLRLYTGYVDGTGTRTSPSLVWEAMSDNGFVDSDTVDRMSGLLIPYHVGEQPAAAQVRLSFFSQRDVDAWVECLRVRTAGNGVSIPNGSSLAPTLGFFVDDPITGVVVGLTSGFFSAGPDIIGVSCSKTERVRFSGTEAILYNGHAGQDGAHALIDAPTIVTHCGFGNIHSVTLTASRDMGAPTNAKTGFMYTWVVNTGAGGANALTWNAVFKWPGGTAPTLTLVANTTDIFTGFYDGTNFLMGSPAQNIS